MFQLVEEELSKIRGMIGEERFDSGKFPLASELFRKVATADELEEFLTLGAYEQLD